MQDEVEKTMREAEASVTRSEALLREVQSLLRRDIPDVAEASAQARAWLSSHGGEHEGRIAEARAELLAEIERDLPQVQARTGRPAGMPRRPRQMV
jgi:hypothetical protein